jgi:hypothetical protein
VRRSSIGSTNDAVVFRVCTFVLTYFQFLGVTAHIRRNERTVEYDRQSIVVGKFQRSLRQLTRYALSLFFLGNFDVEQENGPLLDTVIKSGEFSVHRSFEPAGDRVVVNFQICHLIITAQACLVPPFKETSQWAVCFVLRRKASGMANVEIQNTQDYLQSWPFLIVT